MSRSTTIQIVCLTIGVLLIVGNMFLDKDKYFLAGTIWIVGSVVIGALKEEN